MDIFDVIIFFGLRMIPQKTVKPTYLGPLDARKLAEGKGHDDCRVENLHVLSRSVLLKSVLFISCVFWIFFQNAGSQPLFQIVHDILALKGT